MQYTTMLFNVIDERELSILPVNSTFNAEVNDTANATLPAIFVAPHISIDDHANALLMQPQAMPSMAEELYSQSFAEYSLNQRFDTISYFIESQDDGGFLNYVGIKAKPALEIANNLMAVEPEINALQADTHQQNIISEENIVNNQPLAPQLLATANTNPNENDSINIADVIKADDPLIKKIDTDGFVLVYNPETGMVECVPASSVGLSFKPATAIVTTIADVTENFAVAPISPNNEYLDLAITAEIYD